MAASYGMAAKRECERMGGEQINLALSSGGIWSGSVCMSSNIVQCTLCHIRVFAILHTHAKLCKIFENKNRKISQKCGIGSNLYVYVCVL